MKKVLSIVLSLVMVLCMMPVMAFAGTATSADYTDAASIQYKEAVDVLTSIGVIDGVGNGLFKPEGNVTREQAAKIICTLLLGDKAENLATATAPFKDVAAGRWSAPYIAYGVELGILVGVGNGNFNPTGNVTALQFAKMLLVALGYDAGIEKLEGDAWGVRTSALAEDNDLFEGNADVLVNKAANREEAALYAFNALSADKVDYENRGTEITLSDGTKVVVGASSAKKIVNRATTETIKDDDILQFAEKHFDKLVLEVAHDDFGRPANKWTNDSAKIGTYDTKTPVVTYTTSKKEKDIFSDLGADGISGQYAKYVVMDEIYIDGALVAKSELAGTDQFKPTDDSNDSIKDTVIIAKGDNSNVAGLGEGIKAEIFKTKTANHYTMVITNEYLAKVKSVTKADTNKDEGRKINMTVYAANDMSLSFETDDFEKNDYVLVTVANGEVKTVTEAKKVENVAVTSYKSDAVTAGKTTYKYSQYAKTPARGNYEMSAGNTYTFYLDSCGNVIMDEVYEATNEDYVFVVAVSKQAQGDDAIETEYYNVKYIDAAGKTAVVKSEIAPTADSTWYTVEEDEDNAGYFEFTAAKGAVNKAVTELSKTKPAIAEGILANADTVFVLQTAKTGTPDKEKAQYKTYTGIANVPSYTAINGNAYAVVKDNYAKVVYIDLAEASASSTDSDEVIYIFDAAKYSTAYDADNKVTYHVYDAIVNGEKTTVNVRLGQSNRMEAGLVKIDSRDAYGYIQKVSAVSGAGYDGSDLTNTEITYSAPTLKIGANAYLIDASTAVYTIDSDDAVTEGSVEDLEGTASGKIYVVYKSDKDKTVTAIYFDGSIK